MSDRIILGLQAGRGVAALAVVLFHAEGAFNNMFGITNSGIFSFGHAGVHFFFVISGFIMMRSHRDDIGRQSLFRIFWLRRFVRILPLFWLIMAVYAAKSLALHQWNAEYFWKSTLLVPMAKLPLLVQSWTLTHEFIFYGFFSLLIAFGGKMKHLISAWSIIIIFMWISRTGTGCDTGFSCTLKAVLNPINLLFGFGMLSENISRNAGKACLKILFWLGCLYLMILIFLEVNGFLNKGSLLDVFGYGTASFLIVCGLPSFSMGPTFSRISSILGNISYSAYLVHGIIISSLFQMAAKWIKNKDVFYLLTMPTAVIVTVVLSMVIFYFFERPLSIWFAPLTRRPKKTADPGMA